MKHIKIFLFLVFTFVVNINLFGQTSTPGTTVYSRDSVYNKDCATCALNKDSTPRRPSYIKDGKDANGMIASDGISPRPQGVYIPIRAEIREAFEKTKNQIVPPQSYRSFLTEKNTKLARLQDDKNCYSNKVVLVEELERCSDIIPIYGGGSLYSFDMKSNFPLKPSNAVWWDIHFTKDKMEVGKENIQGVISDVGDVKLADIDINSPAIKFLTSYEPKITLADARQQNKILEKGITANNFTYSNSAPVKIGNTYVLRSVAYPFKPESPLNSKPRDFTFYGIDLIVAFKVVGMESDGSIIILWKEVKKEKLSQKYKM